MTYTAPTTRVTGELITAPIWNTDIVDNIIFLNANLGTSFATLNNGSGGTRTANDLVVWNTASDSSFTTSTEQADIKIAGVVTESIANGANGLVQVSGRRTIATTGVVSRGDGLRQSTTAATAGSCDYNADGCFAVALTGSAGGTSTVECLLLLPAQYVVSAGAKRTTALSITSGAWRSVTLTTQDHDTDAMFAPTSQRITVPVDGLYNVAYAIHFSTPGAGSARESRVFLNSATQLLYQEADASSGAGSIDDAMAASNVFSLSATNTLDLQAQVSITQNTSFVEFSVTKVGRT